MAQDWQLWLSPRPLRRTETPSEPRMLSANDMALYQFRYEDDGRFVVHERHYADNKAVRDGLSGPPLHIHCRQNEYFQVIQGTLGVVNNKKSYVLTKDDGIFKIPMGTRFWAQSPVQEDLVFKVWAEPDGLDHGFDEQCLRNFLGYLRDCERDKIRPSVFQVALLGWDADTILLCPPFWVPIPILKAFQHIVGHFVGKLLLGYQASYPEYDLKPRPRAKGSRMPA